MRADIRVSNEVCFLETSCWPYSGFSATGGVAAAGVSLYRALTAVRVLISVGTDGSRCSERHFQYGGSRDKQRRAVFARSLAAENSPETARNTGVKARTADARIVTYFQELLDLDRSLRQPDESPPRCEENWRILYGSARKGDLTGLWKGSLDAHDLEAGSSSVAFERVRSQLASASQQKALADFSVQSQQETVLGQA